MRTAFSGQAATGADAGRRTSDRRYLLLLSGRPRGCGKHPAGAPHGRGCSRPQCRRAGSTMIETMMQWFADAAGLGVTSSAMLALVFFAASFVLVPRTFLCLGAGAGFGLGAVL